MSPEARERAFDALATEMASGSISRGKALRLMGAALVGGTLGSLGIGEAGAAPPGCKRVGKHCTRDTQCCGSLVCVSGTCADACASGQVLCNGSCVSNNCGPAGTFNPNTCACECSPTADFCKFNPLPTLQGCCPTRSGTTCVPLGTVCSPPG